MKRRIFNRINTHDMTPFQLWYYSNRLDKFFYNVFNNLFIAIGFIGIFGEIVFAVKFTMHVNELRFGVIMFMFCGLIFISGIGINVVEKIRKYYSG